MNPKQAWGSTDDPHIAQLVKNGGQIQIEENKRSGPQNPTPASHDAHYNTFDDGKQYSMAYGLQLGPDFASPTDILVSETHEELVMDSLLPSSPHIQTKL